MSQDGRALARALDGQELVIFDEETDLVFAWNGSATFNVYTPEGVTVDMWTTEEQLPSAGVARQVIRDRIAAVYA